MGAMGFAHRLMTSKWTVTVRFPVRGLVETRCWRGSVITTRYVFFFRSTFKPKARQTVPAVDPASGPRNCTRDTAIQGDPATGGLPAAGCPQRVQRATQRSVFAIEI